MYNKKELARIEFTVELNTGMTYPYRIKTTDGINELVADNTDLINTIINLIRSNIRTNNRAGKVKVAGVIHRTELVTTLFIDNTLKSIDTVTLNTQDELRRIFSYIPDYLEVYELIKFSYVDYKMYPGI